jgi:hypothetical protein
MKIRLRNNSFLKLEKFIKTTRSGSFGAISTLVSSLLSTSMLMGVAFAQTSGKGSTPSAPATSLSSTSSSTSSTALVSEELQTKLKYFLAPESGLNNEIRAGLARIEQACDLAKTKAAEPSPLYSKSSQISKEIAATRELISQQQSQLDQAFVSYRSSHALNVNSCAALPSFLRIGEQCVRYQNDLNTVQAVSATAQTYYTEALARLKSYEAALDLEAKGCTRADFAFKLWSAEQAHITPKLKTSAERLSAFLN